MEIYENSEKGKSDVEPKHHSKQNKKKTDIENKKSFCAAHLIKTDIFL